MPEIKSGFFDWNYTFFHLSAQCETSKNQIFKETSFDFTQRNKNVNINDEESEDEEIDNLFSANHDSINDEGAKREKKEKFNAFNLVTMLTEEDPSLTMIVNDKSKEKITKKLKRGKARVHEIAPGEGKVSFNPIFKWLKILHILCLLKNYISRVSPPLVWTLLVWISL